MIAPRLDRPWLDVRLPSRMRTLGWCLNAPGFGTAEAVHWREVRDADLGPGLEPGAWLDAELGRTGRRGPCFVTSRDVGAHVLGEAVRDGARARCVATVGLSNAEAVGRRRGASAVPAGTINVLVVLGAPLSGGAMVEALSIAAEARTAAVLEARIAFPAGGLATGTGTDCILVAAPEGEGARHAGKHTAVGEAVGSAVSDAVGLGARDWTRAFG